MSDPLASRGSRSYSRSSDSFGDEWPACMHLAGHVALSCNARYGFTFCGTAPGYGHAHGSALRRKDITERNLKI